MKVILPLLITVALFIQGAFACTIDYTPIEELIEDADHIFIGYVVEINYVDYEAYIKETYENRPYEKGEEEPIYIGSVMYDYRTLPVEIFKQKNEIPSFITGGYCKGAQIEGTGKYIIMTYKFEDADGYGSKAWSSDNPYFKNIGA
ncbi:hypothetical protein [Kangiella sediminilitoris]|uniref:Lipoprotein n=1 Tax=Kangiella sediminilitoris TaxID=1144748 RepID=A0A1B3BBZ1_9GAMM|nr:hypothetical protein [Kangiella sediminilitoris]AOE50311.1 hypothetical protein KS2013_1601 [Kangiella sediminilitoris]